MPASIIFSNVSGASDAGPTVQTILVLFFGSAIYTSPHYKNEMDGYVMNFNPQVIDQVNCTEQRKQS
jgi:hypothetical protein